MEKFDYFGLAVELVTARAKEYAAERAIPRLVDNTVVFLCKGCGKESLNTGDWPFCSYLCRWTPRETETRQ